MSDTAAIWQDLSGDLRVWLRRRVPQEEVAEDLLQETFARVHARRDTLRDAQRLVPWVYRIARSVLIDHLRRQRPSAALEEDTATTAGLDEDDPDALVASWLPKLLAGLPEGYREPLRLVELEGRSQAEVAAQLGLSPSGARSRIQRGRALLREALLACCEIQRTGGQVIDWRPRSECRCTPDA